MPAQPRSLLARCGKTAEVKTFDLLLIDGNHDYEYALFDLQMAARLVRPRLVASPIRHGARLAARLRPTIRSSHSARARVVARCVLPGLARTRLSVGQCWPSLLGAGMDRHTSVGRPTVPSRQAVQGYAAVSDLPPRLCQRPQVGQRRTDRGAACGSRSFAVKIRSTISWGVRCPLCRHQSTMISSSHCSSTFRGRRTPVLRRLPWRHCQDRSKRTASVVGSYHANLQKAPKWETSAEIDTDA